MVSRRWVNRPTGRFGHSFSTRVWILTGLWSGEPFSYAGEHYRLEEMILAAPPPEAAHPCMGGGAWPSRKSMGRALRYDGVLAAAVGGGLESPGVTPETIREIKEYVGENREEDGAFDIVWEGQTPGGDPRRAASIVRPFAEAGATWWIESLDASQRAGGSTGPHKTRTAAARRRGHTKPTPLKPRGVRS